MLNNQPMGFYAPAVLVKDAQRHGLRVKPVDIQQSGTVCTVEHETDGGLSLRLGLNYVRGLKAVTAQSIEQERNRGGTFRSVEDLTRRLPVLRRADLTQLGRIGALNRLEGVEHRRDALWQLERSSRRAGPLLANDDGEAASSPLRLMRTEERLVADYAGTGLTTGHHPMAYRRAEMRANGILSAKDLRERRNGEYVISAGCVIARQRPGTALGFIFLSLEDETGISNVVVHPDLYERERLVVTRGKFLKVFGPLQNTDGVIHVKAQTIELLQGASLDVRSHDFH